MSADIAGFASKRQTHRRSGGEHAITGPQALIAAGNRSYDLSAVPRKAGRM